MKMSDPASSPVRVFPPLQQARDTQFPVEQPWSRQNNVTLIGGVFHLATVSKFSMIM